MVSWKIALFVILIAVLVMAIGMWFGYRYVSEQDDISPEGWRERPHRTGSHLNLYALVPVHASVSQE